MRQAGILAAAGIVALETMTGRLVEDHARAKKLAAGLRQIPGLVLDPQVPATNMVFLALTQEVKSTPDEVAEKLKREGILVGVTGPRTFRLVLHYWIDDPGVEKTIAAFQQALQ
jgi:threonine aldolase